MPGQSDLFAICAVENELEIKSGKKLNATSLPHCLNAATNQVKKSFCAHQKSKCDPYSTRIAPGEYWLGCQARAGLKK